MVRSGKSHARPVSTSNTSRKAVLLLLQKNTRENMHRYMARSIRTRKTEASTLESKMQLDSMRCDTMRTARVALGKAVSHPLTLNPHAASKL